MAAANPVQGEVCFKTDDGREFRAVFDVPAICALEDLRDRSFIQVLGQVLNGRIGFIRDALWCALRRHHPDVTQEAVGNMLMGMDRPAKIVSDAMQAAYPKAKKRDDGDEGDPPPAPGETGTGKLS